MTLIHKAGFTYATGADLDNAGDVMGYLCTDECTNTFRYRYKDGSFVDIRPDLVYVTGYDMNASGDVAGTFDDQESGLFVYIDDVFTQIEPVGDFTPFVMRGINSAGQVVGLGYFPVDGIGRGFVWENGVLTMVPNGTFTSVSADAINNAGQIAGTGYLPNSSVNHVFLRSGGHTVDLGTVPNAEGEVVLALSGSGIIAGFAYVENGNPHAIRSANGKMIDLGTLGR